MEQDHRMRFQLSHRDGLLVRRLLDRDGFAVDGPDGRGDDRRTQLSVVAETEGRAARVREVVARWAPEAVRVDRFRPDPV
ncbi:hypothetical protein [Nocardioides lianchengensis]|nr:hypothetical protein [Nocardioides lianchengensis]NYG11526.1 hypothetical protein [Nocardioides lianchengensis]